MKNDLTVAKENGKLTTLATLAIACHSNSVLSVLTIGNVQTTLVAISFTVGATNWIKVGNKCKEGWCDFKTFFKVWKVAIIDDGV